jgi:adenylylsulfate kinase
LNNVRDGQNFQTDRYPSQIKRSLNQSAVVIWLTGLSGAGKTTTGKALKEELHRRGAKVEFLDGDELRRTISSELGFSNEDREIHAKRVSFLSHLLSRNGIVSIVALISPFRSSRQYARNLVDNFVEVWVQCSLDTCRRRDPKGLYKKAREGKINDMTGIQAPYEAPANPEVVVNTEEMKPQECVKKIISFLERSNHL